MYSTSSKSAGITPLDMTSSSLGELPAVAAAAPGGEGVVIAVLKDAGVAEDALVQPLADAVDDDVRRGELHVRDPHADELLVLVREHHALVRVEDVVAEAVGVHGVCVAAVDYLVEIVRGQPSCALFFKLLFVHHNTPRRRFQTFPQRLLTAGSQMVKWQSKGRME